MITTIRNSSIFRVWKQRALRNALFSLTLTFPLYFPFLSSKRARNSFMFTIHVRIQYPEPNAIRRIWYGFGRRELSNLFGINSSVPAGLARFRLHVKVDQEEDGEESSEEDGEVGAELDLEGEGLRGKGGDDGVGGEGGGGNRGRDGGDGGLLQVEARLSEPLSDRSLVRSESHGGGDQAEKGDDLEGLHGKIGGEVRVYC
mmetsp:Transcript_33858/g.72204  ORF Transcript_33858/g.72204 Transcript_33858/m.72204 type:complete len:201 (-) Transcript_33858:64-666(-)